MCERSIRWRYHVARVATSALLGFVTNAVAAPQPDLKAQTPSSSLSQGRSQERSALVEIRAQNRTVALGFVLDGDGRILSVLSSLGRGVGLVARYANGSTAKLRVQHTDRAWDLALLSPDDQRWTTGLLAAKSDLFQAESTLRLLRLDPRGTLREVPLSSPRRENLIGGDTLVLSRAITFAQPLTATDLGAPIIDSTGAVAAMVAQACLPTVTDRCSPIYYAAPTSELRRFIRDGIVAENAPLPWLGLTVSQAVGQVPATRIDAVLPNSPASALGLRSGKQGDLLLAIDGTPIANPQDFAELLRRHRYGDLVTLLLLVEGRYQEVRVALGRYPDGNRPSTGSGLGQPDLGY